MELQSIVLYLKLFFNNFLRSCLIKSAKIVHDSEEIVNLQDLFVLTVGYVDIKIFMQ